MAIITERNKSLDIFNKACECNMSIAIFCTASHWNTEAILIAADRISKKYDLKDVPVVVATTYKYPHMPQAKRFSYSQDARAGFFAHIGNLHALAEGKYAPYNHIQVLPHLDHGDPFLDKWVLTVGLPYFSSVMFDAQRYPYEQNLKLTKEYVKNYGDQILVEGIMEGLNVSGAAIARQLDNYCERAVEYVRETGVDFLVADLGTEQQSTSIGSSKYDKERARELTKALNRRMLVLHGTSCLTDSQTRGLADDGIIRVNMWTRIAREAGQQAAEKLIERIDDIRRGDFEATEANAYIRDNVEKAVDIMVEMMELFGYANWKK